MQPLTFTPLIKRARWGGTQLATALNKPIGSLTDAAESWELCDHGSDQTIVAGGEFSGWSLQRLVRERQAELFGRHTGQAGFPLLLKFLDVQDRLSVQVHPNDEQAQRYVPGERGKTEAWVIVSARPQSFVFVGLARGVDEVQLRSALQSGEMEPCLQKVFVKAGDVVFVPAGTIHALGPGLMVAEVQQSSVQTYRLWDWGRVGADGQPRPLHVEQAIACTDFTRGPGHVLKARPLRHGPQHSEDLLVDSAWFVMHRHIAAQRFWLPRDGRLRALMVLAGQATLRCGGAETPLSLGDTVLLPAAAPESALVPVKNVTVLEVFLP